jgi:hypothetical protein
MNVPTDLAGEIVRLCGLSALLAPGLLRRALSDVGAADPPSAGDLLRALPMIEMRMRAYLPREEVQARSNSMRRLLNELAAPQRASIAPGRR